MAQRAARASAMATRDRLITVAMELFHARGYHAVGVQDLVAAAGIPKGSFYNHFASKQELALAALENYAAHSPVDLLSATPEDPIAGLRAHFNELQRRFEEVDLTHGCMMGNFANELADRDHAVRDLLAGLFAAWSQLIAANLRQAEAAGARLALPADRLAGLIISLWEGSLTRTRSDGNLEPLQQFHELVFDQLITTTRPQES